MAAVLVAGPDAVLSHRPAAALHAFLSRPPGPIDVTLPRKLRPRPGLACHRARLPTDEVVRIDRIPVTGLSRTLLDIAARSDQGEIERALHEAEVKQPTDRISLEDLLGRYPSRQGVGKIRAALADGRLGGAATRSELEERFLAFLRERGLTRPESNALLMVRGSWDEVDCMWRDPGLILELDGHAFHKARRDFERDRARDRALQTAGWKVLRVTWRQLHDDADGLAADLRRLLGQPIRT